MDLIFCHRNIRFCEKLTFSINHQRDGFLHIVRKRTLQAVSRPVFCKTHSSFFITCDLCLFFSSDNYRNICYSLVTKCPCGVYRDHLARHYKRDSRRTRRNRTCAHLADRHHHRQSHLSREVRLRR